MNIEHLLNTYSLYLLAFGTASLAVLAVIALNFKKLTEESKKLLFLAIVLVTLIPTFVMAASTLYINTTSSSGGPVHWHADVEVWNCGQEVNLKDPKGISNKIGSSTLHEHNDKRIHLEGVVLEPRDASLGNLFQVIGGYLTNDTFTTPVNEGLLTLQNGAKCGEKGPGEVQVFVYQADKENYYSQKKIAKPQDYIISPFSSVPAGDCIIVEFDVKKPKTDKLCRSYKVSEKIGKLKGEK